MACPQCLNLSYRKRGRGIDLFKCEECGYEEIDHDLDDAEGVTPTNVSYGTFGDGLQGYVR